MSQHPPASQPVNVPTDVDSEMHHPAGQLANVPTEADAAASQPASVPAEADGESGSCCEIHCGHTTFIVDEVKACGTTGKVCMPPCCVDLVARAVLRLLQDHHQAAAIRDMIRSIIFEEFPPQQDLVTEQSHQIMLNVENSRSTGSSITGFELLPPPHSLMLVQLSLYYNRHQAIATSQCMSYCRSDSFKDDNLHQAVLGSGPAIYFIYNDTSSSLYYSGLFLAIKYLGFNTIRHREAINTQRHQPCTTKTRRQRTKKCDDSPTSNLPLIARVAKLFEPHDSDEDEETEEVDEPQTLAECLAILKEAKDKFVLLVKSPTEFIQVVLKNFLDTIPDDADTHTIKKGDITVIQDAINSIEDLHRESHRGQDMILQMCGVCNEWKAGNEICQAMRLVVAQLDDILIHASVSGVTEIAIAHELGELMYQQSDY
ncbi:hypothetical protein P692DRAFT_20820443 [Suillus brevipes Sb2]|nr:hypothetical protein P692DRAFT_20820443 [Suillus brevipes Sb2]